MNCQKEFELATLPLVESLYRTALRMVPDPASAEICLVQTYSQAAQSFRVWRDGDNPRVWMFTRLFHVIHDRQKRWATRWFRPDRIHHQDEMLQALDNIPAEFREVVLLADVEGFQRCEIAAILGLSLDDVAVRLAEGRARLRAGVAAGPALSNRSSAV